MQFSFEGRILKSLPMLDTSHVLSECLSILNELKVARNSFQHLYCDGSLSLVKIFEGSLKILQDLHEDLCEDLHQDL